MSFFVQKYWNIQDEIQSILRWGCFQDSEDGEKKEKDFDAYDLLHGMRAKREAAYYLGNRILCQKLCNNTPSEYEYLYNTMEIIELYKYAAVGLANYHVSK